MDLVDLESPLICDFTRVNTLPKHQLQNSVLPSVSSSTVVKPTLKNKTDADTVNADKTHDRLRTNLLATFTQLHLKGRPGILSLIPGFRADAVFGQCSRTPHDQAERSSD